MESRSPIPTTDIVAGRCALNNGPLSSQSRTTTWVGDGRIYAASIPIAAACQKISRAATRIAAGRFVLRKLWVCPREAPEGTRA